MEMLNVSSRSRVSTQGVPSTTSSTYLQARTERERSCRDWMGWLRPRFASITSSGWIPTNRKSPRARAAFSTATCPAWNMSKAPSKKTMVAPESGWRPEENWTKRREVGRKWETRVAAGGGSGRGMEAQGSWDLGVSGGEPVEKGEQFEQNSSRWEAWRLAFSGGLLTHIRSLPTRSVVETPSVRLMVTNLPRRFTCAYASVPSGSRQGSSPCTMTSILCFSKRCCMNSSVISYGVSVITSSTHFTAFTIANRSSLFNTGGPFTLSISLSGIRPTTRTSPHARACLSAFA
mmetsp:Transcript_13728/g.18862  ORF Transcript_13728/g.18862 Transcript_13728/m.18862 type:complete len:290 (-) Transcript_13728:272-1141(-)